VIAVQPKKSLGQHFLTDKNIAQKIVNSLTLSGYRHILEIGPGMGILTGYLLELEGRELNFVEIDRNAVEYLQNKYPALQDRIISANFLDLRLEDHLSGHVAIIGNFPYNISSQLFFRILEYRNQVVETVCMIQKEVAQRIASPPGSKEYGILSVLLQAWYHIEYLFTVPPQVFIPPPRVQSAVIRLTRNNVQSLGCNEELFRKVVKTAFNQRRKTLRNSLKNILLNLDTTDPVFQQRPEQLDVEAFVALTTLIERQMPV
jgi:16S rRNA (adenine1518-N6/adenine1519-N6)-dimethyltransferase